MTPSTAVMFPGQGSQAPTMREDVERLAPELLEIAEREVGADPFVRLEEGTRYVQPAILCASLAGWRLADEQERPAAASAATSPSEWPARTAGRSCSSARRQPARLAHRIAGCT